MGEPTIYTVGGTVQAGGGVYIPRQADEELLSLCQSAIFTYVLTPRQMGKSSLMVRTAQTLTAEGIQAVIVDLQELGANVTAEQWYFGFRNWGQMSQPNSGILAFWFGGKCHSRTVVFWLFGEVG